MSNSIRILVLAATAALSCLSGAARADDPAAGYHWPVLPWHTHQLTHNIFWIEGGGGNSGILVGPRAIVVYDAKTTAEGGQQLLQRIAKLSSKPISTVILSHSDVDHVGGLRAFPKGIEIIAQENALTELQVDLKQDPEHALPAEFFPTKTVGDHQELAIDGFKCELLHWAPAHTSGDLMLYLPAQKIVFTGDIITQNRAHPLIHLNKNGASEGWIASVKGLLALDATRYVPGHGDVMNRQFIEKMLKAAESERAMIAELVTQGKSLQEIEAATGDPSPAEAAGPPFPSFAEVVYRELTHTAH